MRHEYHTRSTRRDLKIGICAACHPFFTGEQKFVDTAGRIEKFSRRYGGVQTRRTRRRPPRLSSVQFSTFETVKTPRASSPFCFSAFRYFSDHGLRPAHRPQTRSLRRTRSRDLRRGISMTIPKRAQELLREHTRLKELLADCGQTLEKTAHRTRREPGTGQGRRTNSPRWPQAEIPALEKRIAATGARRAVRPAPARSERGHATPSWKSAPAPAATKPRSSPPIFTACITRYRRDGTA